MFKKVLKLLSVCLSVAILLSALMLPMGTALTAFADESTLTINNLVGTNHWAAMLQTTNSETGGVKFTFTNAFRNIRLGFTNAATLDGLNLKVANIEKTAQLDPIVSFVIANKQYVSIDGTGYFILTLDTESGELQLIRNKDMDDIVTIIRDDKLLYSNVTGKTLLITANWQDGGSYGFNVNLGSDNVSGSLSADDLALATTFDSNSTAYLTVTPGVAQGAGKDQSFGLDVLQFYSNAPSSSAAVSVYRAISTIGTVNLDKGHIIRNARSLYDALSVEDKTAVSNYSVLTNAEAEYVRLSKEADSYMVEMNTAHARCTNAANLMNSIYGSAASGVKGTVTVTDLETGGMRLSIPKGSPEGVREYYTSNVNLDGVKLQFDNFVDNSGGANYKAGQMAILFGNGELSDPTIANCFALVFNPNSGTLYAIPNEKGTGTFYNSDSDTNIDGYVVIRSEYLKGANLEHRRFSLALAENPEVITDDKGNPHHGYDVTVEISGQKLTGTVPYTGVLDKVSNISYTDNVTVGLSLAKPYGNGGTRGYSVDWLGVYSGVVDGRNNNYVLDSTNATVTGGAVIDQGQVSLPQGGSVEFTVNSESVYLKLMGYNSNSSVQVFINDNFAFDCAPTKLLDRWYNATADIVTSGTTKVKLVNNVASLVTLDGVNIVIKGDINDDGAVNGSDLTVMRKYLLGVADTGILVERADLSGNDGEVNLLDLVALKKIISGYEQTVNNAALLPLYSATSFQDVDSNNTPNWTKDIIIGEVNLRTATEEGTIQAATKVLDHYAEMGINCVWITPVYDGGNTGNGYGNLGIDTIDPKLTQKKNYEEGWAVLKDFIDKAHEKNIRVVLDVVFRGVMKESPLCSDHPAWFETDTEYGSRKFKWSYDTVNKAIADWYVAKVVEIAQKTGCDGFRYDMMPATVSKCSIDVEQMIVNKLHENNLYLFIMSESANSRRDLYATETVSIPEALSYSYYEAPYHLFLGKYSIAEFIRSGSTALNGCGYYKYYTYSLANHDFKTTAVNGSRIAVGYQAMFSPFIPLIYLGEEWNNPYNQASGNPLYYNPTDWSAMDIPENRAFYEDVKTMIRIRRTYPDLFNINADQFKDSNICKLTTSGAGVPAYARYAGNRAALIVPNNFEKTSNVDITVSLADLGLESYNSFTVTDAETGSLVRGGTALEVTDLTVTVDAKDQRVLIITGENK